MMDGIPITGDMSAEYILGLAVLMVLIGWLVPKRTLTKQEQESEKWRLAYEAEREARKLSDSQTVQLLEVARTTHSILVAMHGTAERLRQSGASDDISQKE